MDWINEIKEMMTTEAIAAEILKVDTLETQHSDALDFHSLSVWRLKDALEAAYRAGYSQAKA